MSYKVIKIRKTIKVKFLQSLILFIIMYENFDQTNNNLSLTLFLRNFVIIV